MKLMERHGARPPALALLSILLGGWTAAEARRIASVQDVAGLTLNAPAGASMPTQAPLEIDKPAKESAPDTPFALTMDERIQRDAAALDAVAEHLSGLENSTAQVAEDAMGRVYDMSSVESFMSDHEAAVKEQKELDQEVIRLNSLLETFTKELEMVKTQTKQQDVAFQHATELHNKTLRVKAAEAVTLRPAYEHRRLMEESGKALNRSNFYLIKQNIDGARALKNLAQELHVAKVNLTLQTRDTDTVKAAVLKQHTYAEDCKRTSEAKEAELAVVSKLHDKIHGRWRGVDKRANKTAKARKTFANKKEALLRKLNETAQNNLDLQTEIYRTRAQQEQLQRVAQAELAHLGKLLGEQRTAEESAKAQLKELVLAREAENRRLVTAQNAVEELQHQLLSGGLAQLRSNNTQLKAELQEAEQAMQGSQANLAKYDAEIAQIDQSLAMMKNASEATLAKQQAQIGDALGEVIDAKKKGEDAVSAENQAALSVEQSALVDCNATWDEENKALLQELTSCEDKRQQLRTVRAQVEVLTNTITASETQQAVQA